MTSHKRSRSTTESGAESPKAAKRPNTTKPAEDLAQANARIHELEAQVQELQDYIYSQNVALDAPATIRKHLDNRTDAAMRLAGQVRAAIQASYDELIDQTYNSRKTGVTSDDLSKAMMPYFEDIERVWALPGGLSYAFDLVLKLGECSFGDLDSDGGGYGDRPSDEDADDLLYKMIQERRRIDSEYNPLETLQELKDTAKSLSDYGVETYFPRSIDLLTNRDSHVGEEASKETNNIIDLTKTQDCIVKSRRLPPLPLGPRVQMASKENRRIWTTV